MYYVLSTIYHLISIIYYLLSTVYYLMPTNTFLWGSRFARQHFLQSSGFAKRHLGLGRDKVRQSTSARTSLGLPANSAILGFANQENTALASFCLC